VFVAVFAAAKLRQRRDSLSASTPGEERAPATEPKMPEQAKAGSQKLTKVAFSLYLVALAVATINSGVVIRGQVIYALSR